MESSDRRIIEQAEEAWNKILTNWSRYRASWNEYRTSWNDYYAELVKIDFEGNGDVFSQLTNAILDTSEEWRLYFGVFGITKLLSEGLIKPQDVIDIGWVENLIMIVDRKEVHSFYYDALRWLILIVERGDLGDVEALVENNII